MAKLMSMAEAMAENERLKRDLDSALTVGRKTIARLQERGISQAGELHEYRMENERLKRELKLTQAPQLSTAPSE